MRWPCFKACSFCHLSLQNNLVSFRLLIDTSSHPTPFHGWLLSFGKGFIRDMNIKHLYSFHSLIHSLRSARLTTDCNRQSIHYQRYLCTSSLFIFCHLQSSLIFESKTIHYHHRLTTIFTYTSNRSYQQSTNSKHVHRSRKQKYQEKMVCARIKSSSTQSLHFQIRIQYIPLLLR